MGYTSDLFVKIPKKDKQEFEALSKEHEMNFELIDKEENINYEENEFIRYEAFGLKWNHSFTDVTAINNFINEMYNADPENRRGMIRIGESGESEEYGEASELNMYAVTEMNW